MCNVHILYLWAGVNSTISEIFPFFLFCGKVSALWKCPFYLSRASLITSCSPGSPYRRQQCVTKITIWNYILYFKITMFNLSCVIVSATHLCANTHNVIWEISLIRASVILITAFNHCCDSCRELYIGNQVKKNTRNINYIFTFSK